MEHSYFPTYQCRLSPLVCIIIALSLFIAFPTATLAKPLVASMVAGPSATSVNIDSRFNGTELFLFGARNDPGDIVVVIRGPENNYVVRKKERIAGIWVNRTQVWFRNVDGFYAIASSRPLEYIRNTTLLNSLGISINQLSDLMSMKVVNNRKANRNGQFSKALFEQKQKIKLYPSNIADISFFGETLFSTVIPFPETIPKGLYIAEIYLFNGGILTGYQSLPIIVKKVGFDALLFDFAYDHNVSYGIIAIILAVSAGWLGGTFFRKGS